MELLRSRQGNIALGVAGSLEAVAAGALIIAFTIQEWHVFSLSSVVVLGLLSVALLIALSFAVLAAKGLGLFSGLGSLRQVPTDRSTSSTSDAAAAN